MAMGVGESQVKKPYWFCGKAFSRLGIPDSFYT
jgi:hypothetical protein